MFLGLFSIPDIGTVWLSYVLPISCFAVIPLFLTVKEEYNRLNNNIASGNIMSFICRRSVDEEGLIEDSEDT